MTAPTDEEIREAVEATLDFITATVDQCDQLFFELLSSPAAAMWNAEEFRRSQRSAYGEMADDASDRARDAIVDAVRRLLVDVLTKFAREYPDAARAVREAVPA